MSTGGGLYGSSTTTIVTPALLTLADDTPGQVDGVAFDLFVIEMVNTLRDSSRTATGRLRVQEKEMVDAGILPPPPAGESRDPSAEDEEGLRVRLEGIGAIVGGNVAER